MQSINVMHYLFFSSYIFAWTLVQGVGGCTGNAGWGTSSPRLWTRPVFYRIPVNIQRRSEAGIINTTLLLEADPAKLAAETGIMAHVIQDFQKAIQKKRDTAVIQIQDNVTFFDIL